MSSQGLQCPEETDASSICQQAEDRSLGHEPKTWGYQGSVRKSVGINGLQRWWASLQV